MSKDNVLGHWKNHHIATSSKRLVFFVDIRIPRLGDVETNRYARPRAFACIAIGGCRIPMMLAIGLRSCYE